MKELEEIGGVALVEDEWSCWRKYVPGVGSMQAQDFSDQDTALKLLFQIFPPCHYAHHHDDNRLNF